MYTSIFSFFFQCSKMYDCIMILYTDNLIRFYKELCMSQFCNLQINIFIFVYNYIIFINA